MLNPLIPQLYVWWLEGIFVEKLTDYLDFLDIRNSNLLLRSKWEEFEIVECFLKLTFVEIFNDISTKHCIKCKETDGIDILLIEIVQHYRKTLNQGSPYSFMKKLLVKSGHWASRIYRFETKLTKSRLHIYCICM